ncbi:MAG: hypothetical protein FWF24_06665 [Alphaproteobacteria bacterium]|nr:hypothetical protein [Alphaproteobacteria bacterium]
MQQGSETNGIDPKTLDIALALEEAQQSLMARKKEIWAFFEEDCSSKKAADFEKIMVRERRDAFLIKTAIRQSPKGRARDEKRINTIENGFRRLHAEITKRRKDLENHEKTNQFNYLDFLVGGCCYTGRCR